VDPVCLLVAGIVRATLPEPEFTLAWQHSVQKSRWEERYRVEEGGLRLTEARIEGSGAGMESPPGAVLRDGWWSWHPQRRVPELTLVRYSTESDYTLCWRDRCRDLRALVGTTADASTVQVRPCRANDKAPG
jgi:hypothetical protein